MLRLLRVVRSRPGRASHEEDELLSLAEAAADLDQAACRTLLTVLGPHLLRVVRRVMGASHPDVEDVAQEAAIELVRALPRFRAESSVKHFACRVALQTAMNARRKLLAKKREGGNEKRIDPELAPSHAVQPDDQLAAEVGVQLLRQLCDELPPAQAEVLALHCVLGHTVGEVAAICQAPTETIRSRLRVAKQVLVERALGLPELKDFLENVG